MMVVVAAIAIAVVATVVTAIAVVATAIAVVPGEAEGVSPSEEKIIRTTPRN